ncbi:uncharacterized protein LOC141850321 [Brevipalpus obovatus]|uniref:uncharacterized protein LOC141850321 n=1 Tax=Brevipalpus obovatus TaxID=246614 RepID=UPI003D9ECAE9
MNRKRNEKVQENQQKKLDPTNEKVNAVIAEFFDLCAKGSDSKLKSLLKKKPLSDLINERDGNGRCLLHYCAECIGTSCVSLLLMAKPHSILDQDSDGYTILHLAVINGNHRMVSWLCKQARSIVLEKIFPQFLNTGDSEGHTAFHWAVVCNESRCLDILADAGASLAVQDIHGAHPLHYAAQMSSPHNGISKDVHIGLDILKKLLDFPKINVNCRDKDGRSPLLWASSSGSTDAIMLLVSAGADPGSKDKDGLTALHCASSRGHVDTVETLINLCGAEIDVIDSVGCSPMFYSVTLGHADCTQLLLESGAEPNRQDHKGRTAAHCGAAKGQFETIKILANHGANLWMRNIRGDLPLHEAIKSGRKELVRWLLLQMPSAVNTANSRGRTPLHVAAINNNLEMCKILIDSGAEVNPVMKLDGHLITPLDAALQKGFRSCAKYLLLHGALPASRLNLNSRTFNQRNFPGIDPSPFQDPILPNKMIGSEDNKTNLHNRGNVHPTTDAESSTDSGFTQIQQRIDPKRGGIMSMHRRIQHMNDHRVASEYTTTDTGQSLRSQSIITNVYVNTNGSVIDSAKQRKVSPIRRSRKGKSKNDDSSNASENDTGQSNAKNGTDGKSFNLHETNVKFSSTNKKSKLKAFDVNGLSQRSKSQPSGINNNNKKKKGLPNDIKSSKSSVTKNSKSQADIRTASFRKNDDGSMSEIQDHENLNDPNESNKESVETKKENGIDSNRLDIDKQTEMTSSRRESSNSSDSITSTEDQSLPTLASDPSDIHLDTLKLSEPTSDRRRHRSQLSQHTQEANNLGRLSDLRNRTDSRCSHRLHHMSIFPTGNVDLSHVKAKVDTHGLDLARRPHELKRSREQLKKQRDEMMAKVERSIRKYQLERKILQELQDLKLCQIRSGRTNEPVLVKRLVDKFRKEVNEPEIAGFNENFSYSTYERFLYDQLSKLSKSNAVKVLPIIKSSSNENLALQYMRSDQPSSLVIDSDRIRHKSTSAMSDFPHSDPGREAKESLHENDLPIKHEDPVNQEIIKAKNVPLQTSQVIKSKENEKFDKNKRKIIKSTQSSASIAEEVKKTTHHLKSSKGPGKISQNSDDRKENRTVQGEEKSTSSNHKFDSESSKLMEKHSASSVHLPRCQSRTTAKFEQHRQMIGTHRRNCLKKDLKMNPVEASLNRPKFKRCKSSIPARFKVNISKDEIEQRWRSIKEEEKRKLNEKTQGRNLAFIHYMYEINIPNGELDMIYEDESENSSESPTQSHEMIRKSLRTAVSDSVLFTRESMYSGLYNIDFEQEIR